MDRRKSLKIIGLGTLSTSLLVEACKTTDKKVAEETKPQFALDRNPDELEYEKKLLAIGKFFTDHEMATIILLADIIIPGDEISGSASDAKVPEFIDFIVRDMPEHQVPMRGGLRWLDMQCLKRYDNSFKDCSQQQQIEMVDLIAYPERAKNKPELKPGVSFFSLMRNLTASGFYTSEIGVKDIGYIGNAPTQWNGVPDDVLKQYGLAYTDKELKECVSFTSTK
ncbi:MAG: gluconate 2-dehydrogenase subunit 3 family protein [Bacteroidota bacterium]|nr:gluconate 2-dehydrogenase subunit 3 family protein [Bacteroidota bacterium]